MDPRYNYPYGQPGYGQPPYQQPYAAQPQQQHPHPYASPQHAAHSPHHQHSPQPQHYSYPTQQQQWHPAAAVPTAIPAAPQAPPSYDSQGLEIEQQKQQQQA
eukprot:RCo040401